MEPYNQETKLPIVIGCGHTFCEGCIKQQNLCPICRADIVPGSRKRNFALIETLKSSFDAKPVQFGNDNVRLKGDRIYEICQKSGNLDKILCIDCEVFICQLCQQMSHPNHKLMIPSVQNMKLRKELITYSDLMKLDQNLDRLNDMAEYSMFSIKQFDQSKQICKDIIEEVFKEIMNVLEFSKNRFIYQIESAYKYLLEDSDEKMEEYVDYHEEITNLKNEICSLSCEFKHYCINGTEDKEYLMRCEKVKIDVNNAVELKMKEDLVKFTAGLAGLREKFPDIYKESNLADPKILSYESLHQLTNSLDKTTELNYLKEAKELKIKDLVCSQADNLINVIEKMLRETSLSTQTVDLLFGKSNL